MIIYSGAVTGKEHALGGDRLLCWVKSGKGYISLFIMFIRPLSPMDLIRTFMDDESDMLLIEG